MLSSPSPAPFTPNPESIAESPEEQREHLRVPLEAQVGLASGCNFYAGFTENISEGGIFIATEAPLFLGDRINLTVSFGDTAVTAEAEVMWLRRSAQTGLPDGMGLRFVGLDPRAATAINRFIASNREDVLFYEN